MSTRRFTELAAKLYPITEQNPITRPEDIKQMLEVGMDAIGAGHALFHSLYRDYTGRLRVGIVQPKAKTTLKTIHGVQTIVREDTLFQYGLPVRAFIRAARGKISDHNARTDRATALSARVAARTGVAVNLAADKVSPAYRDGLLALAHELSRRKYADAWRLEQCLRPTNQG